MSASKRGRHRAHVSPPARAGNDQLLGQVEQGSAFQAVGRAGAEALRQRLAPARNGPAEGRKTKWGGGSSRRERQGAEAEWWGKGYMMIWELFNYKPPPSVVERSGGRQTEVWEGGGGGRGSSPPASDSHALLPRKGLPVDEAGRKVGLAGRGPWEDKGSRGSWQAGETWRAWLTPVRLRWPGRDRSGGRGAAPTPLASQLPQIGAGAAPGRRAGAGGGVPGPGSLTSTLPWRPPLPSARVAAAADPGAGKAPQG